MNERIYVCHTFYHVYIACLKELNLPGDRRGQACLVLSTMSNDFGNLKARAERSGLFRQVFVFEEKEEGFFPVLKKYHTDRGDVYKRQHLGLLFSIQKDVHFLYDFSHRNTLILYLLILPVYFRRFVFVHEILPQKDGFLCKTDGGGHGEYGDHLFHMDIRKKIHHFHRELPG